MEFKKVKLGEVLESVFSGGTPSTKIQEYWNGNIRWLSSGETSNDFINDTNSRITDIGVKKSSTKLAIKNDLVMASAGQGKTRGQISYLNIDTYINQSVIAIRSNKKLLNNKYLYYNLKSRYIELRSLSDSASTRGSITTKMIKDLDIFIPPLLEQRKISKLLFTLDSKIEINNKIISNLESQAQAIFKSWFVDFEPFQDGNFVESELGMIPEGWEVKELGEFIPVKTGKKNANIAKDNGEYPFFTCSQDISFTDVYSFDANAILLAGNGDFNVKRYNGKFEAYQRTYVLIPHQEVQVGWIYNLIKYNLPKIVSGYKGSVINYLTKGMIENFKIAVPNDINDMMILENFNETEVLISNLNNQNTKLAELRDALLPKLMAGEIDVSNIKIEGEEVKNE